MSNIKITIPGISILLFLFLFTGCATSMSAGNSTFPVYLGHAQPLKTLPKNFVSRDNAKKSGGKLLKPGVFEIKMENTYLEWIFPYLLTELKQSGPDKLTIVATNLLESKPRHCGIQVRELKFSSFFHLTLAFYSSSNIGAKGEVTGGALCQ